MDHYKHVALLTENFSFSTFLSVDFGDSSGSGFRLKVNEVDYIITAKHVVVNKGGLLKDLWIKSRNYFGAEEDGYSAKIDLKATNVYCLDNIDVAIIRLQDASFNLESAGHDISYASQEDLTLFDDIAIASNIMLVGFPSSLTIDNFYDVDRPLLRAGIIAGKNPSNRTFVIDALAFYGVSGGPIVQTNAAGSLRILGIVSRFVPFITEWKNKHETSLSRQDFFNSGYAICIPTDQIIHTILNWPL